MIPTVSVPLFDQTRAEMTKAAIQALMDSPPPENLTYWAERALSHCSQQAPAVIVELPSTRAAFELMVIVCRLVEMLLQVKLPDRLAEPLPARGA